MRFRNWVTSYRRYVGVLDQPILKERWVGVSGQPSTYNGAPIAVRACDAVGDAYMAGLYKLRRIQS